MKITIEIDIDETRLAAELAAEGQGQTVDDIIRELQTLPIELAKEYGAAHAALLKNLNEFSFYILPGAKFTYKIEH